MRIEKRFTKRWGWYILHLTEQHGIHLSYTTNTFTVGIEATKYSLSINFGFVTLGAQW